MSTELSNIDRIRELCASATKGTAFFMRADADELALRVGIAEADLPSRFVEIVQRVDTNFSAISDNNLREYGHRMVRILALSEQIPLIDPVNNSEDDLLPRFSLDEDDRMRVLVLCSEMRKIIFASSVFDYAHKRRLSNRVSAIERQVHQTKGLLDVILGGLSDVGEALGKFGNDVKPLTDRMTEVAEIARNGSKEYESLPPPEKQKQLPPPSA